MLLCMQGDDGIVQGTRQLVQKKKKKKKDIEKYLCHFDWVKREGYAISCAETAASAQCAQHWSIGRCTTGSRTPRVLS